MKSKVVILGIVLALFSVSAEAQRVSIRLNFPVGVHTHRAGPAPFRGAIWIGPEWRWQRGRYVVVPGYWSRPRYGKRYVPGHWKHSRRGYYWRHGYWR